MIKILFIKSDDSSNETVDGNTHKLPASEWQRLQQIKDPARRIQRYAGRVLIKEMIARFSLTEHLNLQQLQYADGRPYFNKGLNFSLAHSGNTSVCAAAIRTSIGIDIENVRPIDLYLYREYFTTDEWHAMINDHSIFWTLWTRKEALAKAAATAMDKVHTCSVLNDSVHYVRDQFYFSQINMGKNLLCQLATSEITTWPSPEEVYIK